MTWRKLKSKDFPPFRKKLLQAYWGPEDLETWIILSGNIAREGPKLTPGRDCCRLHETQGMEFSALVKAISMLQPWCRSSCELLDLKG